MKSLVRREIIDGKRHKDGRLKLREIYPYGSYIGRTVVDIEEGSIPNLMKLIFHDGTVLDVIENEGKVYHRMNDDEEGRVAWANY